MGIASEENAEYNAKKLEKIILNGINNSKYNNWLSPIKEFIKEELVDCDVTIVIFK